MTDPLNLQPVVTMLANIALGSVFLAFTLLIWGGVVVVAYTIYGHFREWLRWRARS